METEATLARLEADRESHVLAGRSTEAELADLETELGRPLPALYREFLLRIGGGLFYQRHELFGTRRTMIHDIELVPALLSFTHLHGTGPELDELLPFHQEAGVVHAFRQRDDHGEPISVVRVGTDTTFADFHAFLDAVVLPAPD